MLRYKDGQPASATSDVFVVRSLLRHVGRSSPLERLSPNHPGPLAIAQSQFAVTSVAAAESSRRIEDRGRERRKKRGELGA
ncbi:hypothetical protein PR202_gb20161 [Eleusine coracana subsp. coracana]|uniref:Uncharacterized protein n=1 Tax=Eleusine coracana subsp. coracana TaxID=191504 RepID=A0AAV5F9K6_ELECO|nr:hypothetical protein PR202_gb20161 [Eleusine coracana subsp. coracana]